MPAFYQVRTFRRAWRLGLSQLLCLGRHTVTNCLCTAGRQFVDWSADYALFAEDRWEPTDLFAVVLEQILQRLPAHGPLILAMDDTLLKKTGTHAKGVSYRRDPLSPHFHCNFIRAQRFIQVAVPLSAQLGPGPARGIPVAFEHAPSVPRPKSSAPPEQWQAYRKLRRQDNLSVRGVNLLGRLRQTMDRLPHGSGRQVVAVVDASYVNRTVMRGLPGRMVLIGRVRKDLKLFGLPIEKGHRYGPALSTPQGLRTQEQVPWQTVQAFAAGRLHQFHVKTVAPVLWKKAGWQHRLRLLVVAPLGYRLRKDSKLLYRQPAYLICTDPQLPLADGLQDYLWRWSVEVNHRDEKQLIGVGEAQLTNDLSVERQPAFAVFSYAMLLLAAADTFGPDAIEGLLPAPKWRAGGLTERPSEQLATEHLIQELRREIWSYGLDRLCEDEDFVTGLPAVMKCLASPNSLKSAVLYGSQA